MSRSPRSLLPYCVVLEGPPEIPKVGVQGAAVHCDSAAGLTVLYSALPSRQLSPDTVPRAALEFWEVIRRVLEQRAVIPFRFPTWVSKTELRKHLKKHAEDYSAFLRQFADYVQVDIRVTPRFPDEARVYASPSGTEYMKKLQRWKRWIISLRFAFEDITKIRAHSWQHRDDGNTVRMFALVERKHAAEFCERLLEFKGLANVNIHASGPWPATEFMP